MMKQKNTARGEREGDAFAFSNMSGARGKHKGRGWPSVPSPPCVHNKASDRRRAWWHLLGRTCSPLCQMQTLQFLYSVERTNFGADWMASLCLLWSYQEISHQTLLTEDARYCWKSPCTGRNHKKGHDFIKCFHFLLLFRDSIEEIPVMNKKCNRQEQDLIVLVAVQIQRRDSHSTKSRDYKILMNFRLFISDLLVHGSLWIIIKYFFRHTDLIFKTELLNHTQVLATAAETTNCFPFKLSDAPDMLGEALDPLL